MAFICASFWIEEKTELSFQPFHTINIKEKEQTSRLQKKILSNYILNPGQIIMSIKLIGTEKGSPMKSGNLAEQ